MNQVISASFPHTHYWYDVGMLKVPAKYVVYCRIGNRGLALPIATHVAININSSMGSRCVSDIWSSHIWQSMDQPGKVGNPTRGQLNRENDFSLSPLAPDKFGRARRVRPSHPTPACSFSTFRLKLVLTRRIPPHFRGGVHLFIPSTSQVSPEFIGSRNCVPRWVSPRHYTVDPMLLQLGNPIKCHGEVLSLQPMIPLKRFAQRLYMRSDFSFNRSVSPLRLSQPPSWSERDGTRTACLIIEDA